MTQGERRQRAEAWDVLMHAAIDIVHESGIDSVATRSVAERTNYSHSTVGYHTQPHREFVDRLWKHLGSDLAADVFGIPAALDVHADRLLTWADEHPYAASFFIGHTPLQQSSTRADYWSFLGSIEPTSSNDPATIARLHLMSRRLQAALGYALAASTEPESRRRALTDELISMASAWSAGRSHQH